MENYMKSLVALFNTYKYITVITGAGISTDSGIPDFQSTKNQWKYSIPREEAISKIFFETEPKEFWTIFKDTFNIKMSNKYRPNYAHLFLKKLEDKGKIVNIITQNVDGLHQLAGSNNVYEIHGNINSAQCLKCYKMYNLNYILQHEIPVCNCGDDNFLKPGVVLFGEIPKYQNEIKDILKQTDLLLVLGTSLEIQYLSEYLRNIKSKSNATLCIINKSYTKYDYLFDLVINENISSTLKKINKYIK